MKILKSIENQKEIRVLEKTETIRGVRNFVRMPEKK